MILFIFESIHQVMIAEELLKKGKIVYALVPIPEKFAPECGMGLEIEEKGKDRVLQILKKEEITPKIIVNNDTRNS